MMSSKDPGTPSPRPAPTRPKLRWFVVGLLAYLLLESFLPPDRQPLALVARGVIGAYRSIGSPVSRRMGVRCRFTPSCSAYGLRAYEVHGTVGGTALTAWRLLRCMPWGGSGYDPVD